MVSNRVVRVKPGREGVAPAALREGIAAIQQELHVAPDFPPEVEAAAAAAAKAPRLPDLDRTDLELVTVDPPGSMDLDQALHLARDGDGYVLHYAIADVAAFVEPGGPVDLEAHRRGQTLYGADASIPLHPRVLSEGAASLLPDQLRPALLWTIRLDDEGARLDVQVERARVRSRQRLDYGEVQAAIDDGTASESVSLLKTVGDLRLAREAARGGISLPLPEQEVDTDGPPGPDGQPSWTLTYRSLLPAENWNAQMSLLTGFGAASMMVYGQVGFLRTLPPPDPRDVQRLHRTARALSIDWPAEQLYPDFIRALDPSRAAHAAMVVACTRLLRGSGYVAFDGETPAQPYHAALAAEYAHVTAPLRRLGDRYAGEVCLALCAGTPVPDWVHAALPGLAATMQSTGHTASAYSREVLDLVEAGVLASRVGETFAGVVVDVSEKDPTHGTITVPDPAVEAPLVSGGSAGLPLGTDVSARLAVADLATRKVEFTLPQ